MMYILNECIVLSFRTLIHTVLSIIAFILAYFVSDPYGRIAVMSAFGFILSINLSGLGQHIFNRLSKQKSETLELMSVCKGFLWQWTWKEALFHIALGVVAAGAALGIFTAKQQRDLSDIGPLLGLASWGFVVLDVILSQMQSVYVIFGLVRNRLFPKSVARTGVFTAGKKKLRLVGYFRRFLMEFGK